MFHEQLAFIWIGVQEKGGWEKGGLETTSELRWVGAFRSEAQPTDVILPRPFVKFKAFRRNALVKLSSRVRQNPVRQNERN